MSDLKIFPLTKDHISSVAELEKICFPFDFWSEQAFEESLGSGSYIFLCAKSGGELIGYAGMYRVLDEAHIVNVAVAPGHRRQGVGEKLLSCLFDVARTDQKSCPAKNYFLEVRKSNLAALALYKKLGFTESGIRRGYYRSPVEDAVLMTRTEAEISNTPTQIEHGA